MAQVGAITELNEGVLTNKALPLANLCLIILEETIRTVIIPLQATETTNDTHSASIRDQTTTSRYNNNSLIAKIILTTHVNLATNLSNFAMEPQDLRI